MAERALGQLTGILRTGARGLNPQLVTSPLLRREAISSSRIEGTVTTPEQLVLFEIDAGYEEPSSAQEAQTLEVHNYIRALHHGFARLREIPVCLRLIRELHEILMESVRGGDQQPGQFRSIQNFIGASRDIRAARFVPPPVSELDRCLREFEGYINSESEELPLLVRLALIHYQFETIHPFRDGNGRVGRLLLPLLLYSYDKIEGPVLYVSPYLEQNRSTYTELLLRVSQTGDFASWVRFFLTAVAESANESVARAEALFALRDGYYARLHSARSSALLLKLVDALFERPSMSIGNAAELLEITPASAVANLRRLQDEGIVTEVTGRRRDQRYVAREILSVAHRERP
jgi:Fic family protein